MQLSGTTAFSLPNGRVCLSRRSDELRREGEGNSANPTRIFAGLTFRTKPFQSFLLQRGRQDDPRPFLIRAYRE